MNGWWKFHRQMRNHAVWSLSDGQFKVWITILNEANHIENDWWNGVERIVIPAGSFITSLSHLANLSRTTIKTVRLAIEALTKIGSIKAQTKAKSYTEICVINFDRYRGTDEDEGIDQGNVGAKRGHSRGKVGAITGEVRERENNTLSQLSLAEPVETKTSKPLSPHNAVIAAYLWTYEHEYHSKPPITKAEGAAAKILATGRTAEEGAWMVWEHLSNPSPYVESNRLYSLRDIVRDSAKLLARRRKPLPAELLKILQGENGNGGHRKGVLDDHAGIVHPATGENRA